MCKTMQRKIHNYKFKDGELHNNSPSLNLIIMYLYLYMIQKWVEILINLKVLNSWTRAMINCNPRVRLFGHLFATLSFMLHAKKSSGN